MITAQQLYDRREALGEIDGKELHDIFRAVCNEPSPSGRKEIDPRYLRLYAQRCRLNAEAYRISPGALKGAEQPFIDVAAFCEAFL